MPAQTVERERKAPPTAAEAVAAALPARPRLTSKAVWSAVSKGSFGVLSYVSPFGEPRSSGVVYGTAGRSLYVAVAASSWKARQLVTGQRVSLTIPIRRAGILTLLIPIPPATISFGGSVTVHPGGSLDLGAISPRLVRLLPDARRDESVVLEIAPEGSFVTYGLGVSLLDMRKPELAKARVPIP